MHHTLRQFGLFLIQKFSHNIGSINEENEDLFSRLFMPPGPWPLYMIKFTKIKNMIKV